MRRLSFAALFMLALALASVAPAMAAGGPAGHHTRISVWGTVNNHSQAEIDGYLSVADGTSGPIVLSFYGSKDGKTWLYTGQSHTLNVVKGRTQYGFDFDGKPDSNHFTYFKVGGDGAESRRIGRDECGFRVPEAPATPLLLLAAFPAGGLMALKATRFRLPIPNLHRIA